MQDQFAYSLSQTPNGWRWSIYDTDGEIVASGAERSQSSAQSAVNERLRQERQLEGRDLDGAWAPVG